MLAMGAADRDRRGSIGLADPPAADPLYGSRIGRAAGRHIRNAAQEKAR